MIYVIILILYNDEKQMVVKVKGAVRNRWANSIVFLESSTKIEPNQKTYYIFGQKTTL